MMLDMKRTFDEVVVAHSTPEKAEQILANPFYQAVSSSFAGTQEYMAMEKLGQLHQEVRANGDEGAPRWDLIVVDTPPSRSALDFLDAPKRLGSFLDGRFIRLMTAPAKAGGRAGLRVFNVGIGLVTSTLSRVLGGEMLRDVQTFIGALDTMFGGFRQRADETYALLAQHSTAFLVVAAPERDALREASYFIARLETERMPITGLVLNRVQQVQAPGLSAARARAAAEDRADEGDHLTAALLALHADVAGAADRQRKLARRFSVGHPGTPVAEVPALAEDVHDVEGLRRVGEALAAG
jgi:anion-transporting  ArsA/GET3 family ATPase